MSKILYKCQRFSKINIQFLYKNAPTMSICNIYGSKSIFFVVEELVFGCQHWRCICG